MRYKLAVTESEYAFLTEHSTKKKHIAKEVIINNTAVLSLVFTPPMLVYVFHSLPKLAQTGKGTQ